MAGKIKRLTSTVNIKDIALDVELYPRACYDWQTGYDYSQSMANGVKFPRVVLAKVGDKFVIIDGKHRIEAVKILKQKTIDADILIGMSREQMFIEAVKLNISHGRKLSPYDKRNIALKLRAMKYNLSDISEIIQVPIGKLNNFIAQRLTNSITGETIVKSELKHLAGQDISEDTKVYQMSMISSSQENLLKEVIRLFETKLIDKKDKTIKILIKKLKELL